MTIRKSFSLGYFIYSTIFVTSVLFSSILQAAELSLTEAEKNWIKKHPEITIAFDGDYAPYSFLDEKLEFKGIAVDFAQMMANRAGIKLKFYPGGNWKTLYKAAQRKDVDVIATLVKRSERKKWFMFTEPYISLAQYIIIRKEDTSINSREALAGKRVALVQNYSTSQYLIEEFPTVIPFYVNSLSEALDAVSNGEVDATVAAMGMANQLANQKGITNIKFAALYGQGLSEQRFGIRKDWPELASILNKALDSLSGDERLKLFLNWSHKEVAKVETVKAKPITLTLTPEEKTWLKSHPVIRVMGETDYPPWDFVEDGKAVGYGVDYIKLLADRLGLKLEFIIAPLGKLIEKTANRELDLMHTSYIDMHEKILTSKPYGRYFTVAFTTTENKSIRRESDLVEKTIAVAEGDAVKKTLKRSIPSIHIKEFTSYREALLAVYNNEVDAAVMDRSVGNYLIREHLLAGIRPVTEVRGVVDDPYSVMRLGVRSDWPEFLIILEKAMDSITPAEKDALNQKWLRQLENMNKLHFSESELHWLAKHSAISLRFTPDIPPLLIQDKNKVLTGIIPEIFNHLEILTGLNISIEIKPWSESIEQARQGQIDGFALCAPDLAKETGLLATKGYVSTIPLVFGKKDAKLRMHSLNDLKGKRVVHLSSIKFIENILDRYGDQITAIPAESFIEALTMVLEGKADVVLGMNFDTYALHQSVLTGIEPIFIDSSNSIKGVASVRSEWPELVGILNKGLDAVGEAKINQIVKKWTQIEPPDQKLVLTDSDRIWLDSHPVIRVGIDQTWGPIEFLDSDGIYKGLAIDYLKKIEPLLGVEFKIIQENWQTLIDLAKKQELDFFTSVASTPEREQYLIFTEPYIQMPAGIFARDDAAYITDLKQIAGKKISVVEGYAITDYLAANYPDMALLLVKTPEEGIRKVKQEKAFAFIDNIITTGHLIGQKGYLGIKMAGEIQFEYAQRMGVRKDWPQFRDILQKAIEAIPDSERNATYNKWVPIIHERPIDYGIFWKIGAGGLIFIGFIVFWNRRLKYEVEKKTTELASNEKRLQAIYSNRQQLTGLLSPDGKLIMANANVYNMVGADPDEIVGKYLWELPHWAHSHEMQRQVQDGVASAKKGHLINFETTHPDSEGNIHYIAFSLTPVFDNSGNLIYLVPEGTDITERKNAEKALQESEQKFRSVFESSRDAVTLTDENSFVDCNAAALKMFGYTDKDEFCRHHPADVSPAVQPDGFSSKKKANALIADALHGQGGVFEWTHRRKDGSAFSTEILLSPMKWKGIDVVQAVIRDISERKKLDAELRLVKHSIEHSTDALFWIQKNARFFYVNDAACKSLGFSHEKLCTMYVSDIDPEFPAKAWPEFWEKLRTQKSLVIKSRHQKKNGEIFPVEVTCNYLEFEGQEHLFAYAKDIQEKIKHEEEQKQLEKQLQQAQKMEAIGTLAGGIAHDFNNILSSVLGYTELARVDIPKGSETASYIDQIFKAGQRAGNLVKQILAFSRKQDQELIPIKIGLVIKEALKLLRSSIPTTIEIKSNIDPRCGLVFADPTQIHQIVMNLCTNAYHAMKTSGGELSVSMQPVTFDIEMKPPAEMLLSDGPYLELTISDTGCGIPKEHLEKIFEPYFTTKEKGEGTGLGLATVHSIVRNFKGDIKVESNIRRGTTFFIYLPVIKETATSDSSELETALALKGKERILFVDDEKAVVDFSRIMLEGLGYSFAGYTDSKQALETFKNAPNEIDLIITDMTMPDMTGVELIRQVHNIRSDLPVILCTGYSDALNSEKAKKIGATEYLEKPILKKDLAAKIRKVLEVHSPFS